MTYEKPGATYREVRRYTPGSGRPPLRYRPKLHPFQRWYVWSPWFGFMGQPTRLREAAIEFVVIAAVVIPAFYIAVMAGWDAIR